MTLAPDELRDALTAALGDRGRVATGDSERDLHAGDISFHRPQRPDVVVYAPTRAAPPSYAMHALAGVDAPLVVWNALMIDRLPDGLTQAQAAEAIAHLAFYAGWPSAITAVTVAKEVFEKK